MDLPPAQAQDEYMTRILQAVDRQDKLVENLLTLSNPEPELWQPVSVPSVIDDVLAMLPPDPRLRLVHEPTGAVPAVSGDAFRLSEVFANLIQNALQATPPDGRVEVEVGCKRGRRRRDRPQYRKRHSPGYPRAHLPALLHDEGDGDGPRARHRAPDRRRAPGPDRGGERWRVRDDVRGRAAARAPAALAPEAPAAGTPKAPAASTPKVPRPGSERKNCVRTRNG